MMARGNSSTEVADDPDEWQLVMEKRLSQGKKMLQRLRSSVGGVMMTAGCGFAFVYMYCKCFCVLDGEHFAANFMLASLYYLRYVCFSLAPLAGDVALTRCVLLCDAFILLLDQGQDWVVCPLTKFDLIYNTYGSVLTLCFVGYIPCIMREKDAVAMQARMWRTFCCLSLSQLVTIAIFTSWYVAKGNRPYLDPWMIPSLFGLLFFSRPELRAAIHSLFLLVLERRSSSAAAAGIAGLVGDCSPQEVAAQASSRFRGVLLSDLPYAVLASNVPDAACFQLSQPVASRQRCDAFISHSWHDDAEAKWSALQSWRQEFISQRGREPLVWLDRCCIDQTNIEADLRCLPIFLNKCDQLVMLCGVTFLDRLWCVVEVFTYVHVSGKLGGRTVQFVLREGHEEEDKRAVQANCTAFDASLCDCSDARDKAKMLDIIQTAFGTLQRFNAAVAEIFSGFSEWEEEDSSSSLEPSEESVLEESTPLRAGDLEVVEV